MCRTSWYWDCPPNRCEGGTDGPRIGGGAHLADHLAGVRAVLGDRPEALSWLEQAVDERAALATFAAVDPTFEGLRAEPRYLELVRRMGL